MSSTGSNQLLPEQVVGSDGQGDCCELARPDQHPHHHHDRPVSAFDPQLPRWCIYLHQPDPDIYRHVSGS